MGGILGLYSLTDRRRWYWQCPLHRTGSRLRPGWKLFNLPSDDALLTDIRTMDIGAAMARKYGARILLLLRRRDSEQAQAPAQRAGSLGARGCTLTPDGELVGTPPATKGLGYWLGGVAATYQTWTSLIERYLKGLLDYALTGSEGAAQDHGQHRPRHAVHPATPDRERGRAQNPAGARRGRAAAVRRTRGDPLRHRQRGRAGREQRAFRRPEVHAIGAHREKWLVDRHEIRPQARVWAPSLHPSTRPVTQRTGTCSPRKLLLATWRTPLDCREIKARLVVAVDTGGEGNKDTGSVATNAYAWYRRLRDLKLAGRVMLYKGASTKMVEVIKESKVGKRNSRAKPDIPLYLCDPNKLSDIVDAGLRREEPGPGYIHLPKPKHPTQNPDGWLLTFFGWSWGPGVRGKDGKWSQIRKRNESFRKLAHVPRQGV